MADSWQTDLDNRPEGTKAEEVGAEAEARRKGGRGITEALVAAAVADRLLTMDVDRSAVQLAMHMIYSSDEARCRFFAAPFGAAAVAFPAKRSVAYALDRLEGAVAVGAAR